MRNFYSNSRNIFYIIISAILILYTSYGFSREEAPTNLSQDIKKCYRDDIDPKWNRNDNKPGTECYKQMQKVRKLEFSPEFNCSKAIRLRWEREIKIAEMMKCNL